MEKLLFAVISALLLFCSPGVSAQEQVFTSSTREKFSNITVFNDWIKTLDQKQKNRALIHAIIMDKPEFVESAFLNGADIEMKNARNDTPLFFAVQKGNPEVVKLLLNNHAKVNVQNINGDTPLTLATRKDNPDIVMALLDKSANVNVQNNNGDTPLIFAAQKGYPFIIRALIDRHANINAQNNKGENVLFYLDPSSLKIAKQLIKNGADITVKNKKGKTAYNVCADNYWMDYNLERFCEIMRQPKEKYSLLEIYKLNRSAPEYSAAFNVSQISMANKIVSRAVDIKDCDTVEAYLKDGHDILTEVPSLYDEAETKPLVVLLTSFPQCMAKVLPEDIDINRKFDGDTLLMYAIYNQNTEVAELLLNKGADVDVVNRNRLTPLFIAASQDDVRMVELLLKHHADTTVRNENGETAFDICKQMPTMEICKLAPNHSANDDSSTTQYEKVESNGETNAAAQSAE